MTGIIRQDRYKFRVWHKKRKKMYKVLHLHVGTYENGGDWATAEGFNIITQQNMHIQVEPKDCILMQCLGLKDKKNNLLYEGDIVRAYFERESGDIDYDLMTVVHVPEWCAFVLKGCKTGSYEDFIFTEYDPKEYEIVGNIYENPELLEKTNER